RAALNPAEMNARFGEARATLEQFRPALESIRQERREQSKMRESTGTKLRESTGIQIESAGLPGRDGADPVCEALVGNARVTYAGTAAAGGVFISLARLHA